MRIIPSIASANQLDLRRELQRVTFSPSLHLDIEDGNFIPNITFGMRTVRAISEFWAGELDAHLMVNDPADYLDDLVACGIGAICFHAEAAAYPLPMLHKLRLLGIRAGIAINPGTPLAEIEYLLPFADYFLLMTAEPDGEGQRILPHMPAKIAALRAVLPGNKEIWVDGGIGKDEAAIVCKNGADVVIMGRAIFTSPEPRLLVRKLTEKLSGK